jgi:hypothetical protein
MNDNGCILNFTNLDEAKTSFWPQRGSPFGPPPNTHQRVKYCANSPFIK